MPATPTLAATGAFRCSASARRATGPTRTRCRVPFSVRTCSTKALKPAARTLSRSALASLAWPNAPSCTAKPTPLAAGAAGVAGAVAGLLAVASGFGSGFGVSGFGAGFGGSGLAAGVAVAVGVLGGRLSLRTGLLLADGEVAADGVLALGVAGAGVAATGALLPVAASRVITSAFTSARIFTACSRAASACARSAYGPTRTRHA